jgi:AcrR family transcriptional regulator
LTTGDSTERESDGLRSDAQQNRATILDAALDALTASRTASLNSIAKKAGVGIGTLYRHFPNREALLMAVFRNEVRQLVELAPALLRGEPPLQALRSWMDRLAHYGAAKAGLGDALASSHEQLNTETYGPVIGALTSLLEANERAGTIRAGVNPDDVLLMLGFLWRMDPSSNWEAQSQRLLDILIDGLRAGAAQPSAHEEVWAR